MQRADRNGHGGPFQAIGSCHRSMCATSHLDRWPIRLAEKFKKDFISVKQLTQLSRQSRHLPGEIGLEPRRLWHGGNHVETRSLVVERSAGRNRPTRARNPLAARAPRAAVDIARAADAGVAGPARLSARAAFFPWRAHAKPIGKDHSDRHAAAPSIARYPH
jgi:hypothetical protein